MYRHTLVFQIISITFDALDKLKFRFDHVVIRYAYFPIVMRCILVTIGKLRKAHFAAAKIVEKLGDDYLMFFERIHKELQNAEKKLDLKAVALEVAKKT